MEEEKIKELLGVDENSDISTLLTKWAELHKEVIKIQELDEFLKTRIKVYLKERGWDRYLDEDSQISVSITQATREKYDKVQMRLILTNTQLAQIVQTTEYERMNITTPEARERIKKFVKKNGR